MDYAKDVNWRVWVNAMLYESESPEQFYPPEFQQWADYIMEEELSMIQEDITPHCCEHVYIYLANHAILSTAISS